MLFKSFLSLFCFMWFFSLFFPLSAKSFADIGKTFEIKEESFLEMIQRRLRVAEKSGLLAQMQKDVQEKIKKRVIHPLPVRGIQRTQEERRYLFDPSLVVDKDIVDHTGAIIHKKGSKANPLKILSWGCPLLLIDGDDPEQVTWSLSQGKKSGVKIVLVKGSPILLFRQYGKRFYFDQGGSIIKKFGIRQVPARITQKGLNLLVEEIRGDV